jgi:hypothetical protein
MASPVFKCSTEDGQDMQSFNIPDYSLVKIVNGTKQDDENDNLCLNSLIFSKKDGSEITKVETEAGFSCGPECMIDDTEEIIGIYGY